MQTRFLKQLILAFITYLIISALLSVQAMAEVTASLNQESYYQGDLITLRIESDKNEKGEPDLTELKKDFEVKGSSTSSQINIINGSRSFKKTWNIELQAKATGQLTIPEIVVGNHKTQAIVINVKELPPEVAAETKKHIFIESSVDLSNSRNNEIYVQQQIPYTVKFFYDAAMQTGEVILPTIENANLRVLGNEKKYQVVRAGNKYVVVERRYVISPEKSGKLVIPPTMVQGRIALTDGDSPQLRRRMNEVDMLNDLFFDLNNRSSFSNPFDPFFSRRSIGPTRPFTVSSEEIEVNVLPVPDSFTGSAWLPAEEVKMQDSWATNPPTLKVGEPVTRTIIMQVKGLASSQIPEINIPKPAGMKVYPEQAKSETPNDGNTIYGIQRIDISYIPNQSGAVQIPEIKVDWWDVNLKKQQTYTLPGWNLNVAAGASKPNEDKPEAEINNINSNPETIQQEESLGDNQTIAKVPQWNWQTLLSTFSMLVFLILSFVFLKKYLNNSAKSILKNKKRQQLAEINELESMLLDSCNANDNKTAAAQLLQLAKLKFPDENLQNLGVLASRLKVGTNIVKQLDASLYGSDSQNWQGDELYKLLKQGLQLMITETNEYTSGLAPLYPN